MANNSQALISMTEGTLDRTSNTMNTPIPCRRPVASNPLPLHPVHCILTATLVLVATLAALLASLSDATAQSWTSPQIQVTGSAVGGEVYYVDYTPYPQLRQVWSTTVNQEVSLEAMTSRTRVSYGAALLDGSYLLTVDLPTNQFRVQATAPTYAYLGYWDNMPIPLTPTGPFFRNRREYRIAKAQ